MASVPVHIAFNAFSGNRLNHKIYVSYGVGQFCPEVAKTHKIVVVTQMSVYIQSPWYINRILIQQRYNLTSFVFCKYKNIGKYIKQSTWRICTGQQKWQ